jgi:hypothetical protein
MQHAEKISAFGYNIYKFNIFDDQLTIPQTWVDSAIQELATPEVRLNQSCNLDKGTTAGDTVIWSSFETPAKSFFAFADSDKLLEWIKEKIKVVATTMGFNNVKSANLTIDWMNVMYKGSFGNCHTHHDIDVSTTAQNVVAIFYLQAPKNSSELLVIKNTKDYSTMGISPYDIPAEEIFPISVTTGDLVIHEVDLPHAVSIHQSDTPRLCLVMEFQL